MTVKTAISISGMSAEKATILLNKLIAFDLLVIDGDEVTLPHVKRIKQIRFRGNTRQRSCRNRRSPIRNRLQNQTARALRMGRIADLTEPQWVGVIEYFNRRCGYCHAPLDDFHQDHLVPLSRGGNHTESNVVPACEPCNLRKNDKSVLEFVTGLNLG